MRYTSDLTDAEWQLIDHCFPKPCQTGRPREHSYRELLNGIFYLTKTACKANTATITRRSGGLPAWRIKPLRYATNILHVG